MASNRTSVCKRCGQRKSINLFAQNSRGGWASVCLSCRWAGPQKAEPEVLVEYGPTPVERDNTATGALSELLVATDLMRRGYDVFRALSPSSPCDLIILQGVATQRVEVRTGHRSPTGRLIAPIGNKDVGRSDIVAIVYDKGKHIVYLPAFEGDANDLEPATRKGVARYWSNQAVPE
jgi:hypothetical protein